MEDTTSIIHTEEENIYSNSDSISKLNQFNKPETKSNLKSSYYDNEHILGSEGGNYIPNQNLEYEDYDSKTYTDFINYNTANDYTYNSHLEANIKTPLQSIGYYRNRIDSQTTYHPFAHRINEKK
jgi:hypothetical protein